MFFGSIISIYILLVFLKPNYVIQSQFNWLTDSLKINQHMSIIVLGIKDKNIYKYLVSLKDLRRNVMLCRYLQRKHVTFKLKLFN